MLNDGALQILKRNVRLGLGEDIEIEQVLSKLLRKTKLTEMPTVATSILMLCAFLGKKSPVTKRARWNCWRPCCSELAN